MGLDDARRAELAGKLADALNPVSIAEHGDTVCWTALSWLLFGGKGSVMCVIRIYDLRVTAAGRGCLTALPALRP